MNSRIKSNQVDKKIKGNFYIKKDKSLRLVKFEKKHISKNYLLWLNNKEIKYSQNRFSKHNYPSAIKYLNKNTIDGNLFFAIESKQNKRYFHIGNILLRIDKNNKRGHLSILIGKNKGTGVGFMVWKKAIQIAFKFYNCDAVVAGADLLNKPMIKIFKKTKMSLIKMPNYFYHKKQKRSDLIASYISKKNFKNVKSFQ